MSWLSRVVSSVVEWYYLILLVHFVNSYIIVGGMWGSSFLRLFGVIENPLVILLLMLK